MSHSGYTHVEVERVVSETGNAFLLLIDGFEHWIPKSQIAGPETYERGDASAMYVLARHDRAAGCAINLVQRVGRGNSARSRVSGAVAVKQ